MNAPVGTLEYGLDRSGSYTSTVTLIGQVIALQGSRIARERARPRPDRAAIAALESGRTAAVHVCRTLSSLDPAALAEIRETYARLYLELVAGPAAPGAAAFTA